MEKLRLSYMTPNNVVTSSITVHAIEMIY